MSRISSSTGTSKLIGDDDQQSGRRLVVVDPFDSVNGNLTATGEWSRLQGTAVIGEDGTSAFSTSAISSAIYVNTKNGMRFNRWVRCLVTALLNNVEAGLVVWSNTTGSARIFVRVTHSGASGLDIISLVERYASLDIVTSIGSLAPNGTPRLITTSLVGREIRVDIDNGALIFAKTLAGAPSVPNGRAGLYYNNPGLTAGHAAEWDDFEVRLYPHLVGD